MVKASFATEDWNELESKENGGPSRLMWNWKFSLLFPSVPWNQPLGDLPSADLYVLRKLGFTELWHVMFKP